MNPDTEALNIIQKAVNCGYITINAKQGSTPGRKLQNQARLQILIVDALKRAKLEGKAEAKLNG